MVTAIVLVVLGACMVAAFGMTLRLARRTPHAAARRGRPSAPPAGIDRLGVGAELVYDDQRWDVIGVQHVRPADGVAWAAWHLDDRGQSGWMATSPGVDHVVFAVRAERPETLDPAAERLTWRDHEWVRIEDGSSPARAEGERRLPRAARVPLPDADVFRTVLTRQDLRARRLVLEWSAGEERPHTWIGNVVPAQMIDVWPLDGASTTDAGDADEPGAEPRPPAQPS
ncbi:DUF4178 domain-containing protein [Patulibacter americanus]|uniref:DUF4178 domain-containing protein n=1 Tax=Patulibacter americanus TaxID=588672 RepID=UPI0003B41A2D|nr:DUF4178 domain-containing protein [Patulibacter americanus]